MAVRSCGKMISRHYKNISTAGLSLHGATSDFKVAHNRCQFISNGPNMKLYLDIDGVLLTGSGLAEGAEAFIRLAVRHHDVHWLTTHKTDAVTYLRPYVDAETLEVLEKIRPTVWDVFKTEALDPADPDWLWLDDAPLATELAWLEEHGRAAQWIRIDLDEDPEALVDLSASII
jgi:hypothetical protein